MIDKFRIAVAEELQFLQQKLEDYNFRLLRLEQQREELQIEIYKIEGARQAFNHALSLCNSPEEIDEVNEQAIDLKERAETKAEDIKHVSSPTGL